MVTQPYNKQVVKPGSHSGSLTPWLGLSTIAPGSLCWVLGDVLRGPHEHCLGLGPPLSHLATLSLSTRCHACSVAHLTTFPSSLQGHSSRELSYTLPLWLQLSDSGSSWPSWSDLPPHLSQVLTDQTEGFTPFSTQHVFPPPGLYPSRSSCQNACSFPSSSLLYHTSGPTRSKFSPLCIVCGRCFIHTGSFIFLSPKKNSISFREIWNT